MMTRVIKYVVCTVVLMLLALDLFATVPASPSIVSMNGKQMRVQHRREDNTLKTATNYVIKGVCWSVGTTWPVETYLPGAPFENDDRVRMWEMAQYDFPRIREAGFNTIRLYMDVGIDTDSTLYFNEDTNNVIWNEDGTAQDDDNDHQEDWLQGMAMQGQMSATAVTNGLAVLDEAYKNGLKVIMVVDHFNNNPAIAQKIVNTYKNHPAMLMWMIGNEFNYNFSKYTEGLYMYRYDTFQQACQGAEATAAWIKANDMNHPVAACLGEPHYPTYADYKAGVAYLTDVDVLGINSYRGKSFGQSYETFVDTVTWTKPIFFSEYGVDAWHYNATDKAKEFEDLAGQKEGVAFQWDEIHSRLSAKNSSDIILGSCIFEWVDEWWKYERSNNLIHDTLPGYPINGGQPANPDLYPDGCMHEEWWGLNAEDSKNITPITFYSDAGLIGESQSGEQSWDIYTWGLPIDGTGYGKLEGQSTYVTTGLPDNGVRKTYCPYDDFAYTGVDTIPEGQRCMYTELWSEAYGCGWGVFRTKDSIDLSQYANGNIKVWIKLQNAGVPPTPIGDAHKGDFFFKFEDENGPGKAVFIWLDESYCSEFNANSTTWQEITIPISALCDGHQYVWQDPYGYKQPADGGHLAVLNLAKMRMVFALSARPKASGAPNVQYWVDNVRWDTGASVTYNRAARPALKDYNAKYNTLSYLKSVFEAGATSFTGSGNKYAECAKNYSSIISSNTVATNMILAAAIDSKSGRVVSAQDLGSVSAVNTWIDIYNDAGDNYVLVFAKFNQGILPNGCTNLAGIGSTLYSTVASADPWVFVT
ncbi:MAG: glycoside hydrolase family 2 TIM barrel-domain containing protein, partial [Dehalococcoidales bacterium]|nr:glycoside hydrolase family 2 TIM barrel-domain containing protein [Dehalococcoidales bacterium]